MSKKVLIVDGEANIVRSLQFLLKREGFEVFTAGDGDAALQSMRSTCPTWCCSM